MSGVRERDLVGAPTFAEVQAKVAKLLEGKILVGHALDNDFRVGEPDLRPLICLRSPGVVVEPSRAYGTGYTKVQGVEGESEEQASGTEEALRIRARIRDTKRIA